MSLDTAAALLHAVAARFATGGAIATVEPFSGPAGHINASYVVRSPRGRFFLQRLNTDVFRDHQRLMENSAFQEGGIDIHYLERLLK